MKRRILSIVLCLCLLLALAPTASADGGNYLALGDSISTGYGLADPSTEGFAAIVAVEAGYALANFAVNGNTADGILAQLASGELNEAVAVADVITITCGGNDLMAALYTAVVDTYNADAAEDEWLAPEEVTSVMMDSTDPRYFALLLTAQSVLAGSETLGIVPFAESDTFVTALETYVTNLHNAIGELRIRNADARIIVATQYHPYALFTGMYAILDTGIAPGVAALNEAIVAGAGEVGYEVADVFTAFDAAAAEGVNYCNATTSPLQLDFHPNAAGHAAIAEVVLATLNGETETPDLAIVSTQSVLVDGESVTFEAYALVDENGNPTNYVKLRDVAHVLNGTAAQFEVDWDGAVNILDGVSYTTNGSEMSTPFEGDREYRPTDAVTKVDGEVVEFDAICLEDDDGGEYNYYKLRDLGRVLGFDVSWTDELGIFIETDQPYTED